VIKCDTKITTPGYVNYSDPKNIFIDYASGSSTSIFWYLISGVINLLLKINILVWNFDHSGFNLSLFEKTEKIDKTKKRRIKA